MTSHATAPRSCRRAALRVFAAVACAAAGFAVFQWFGNANRGYIDTASLFWWWGFQWINPASEAQHGWLVLGIAVWLAWRNLRTADCGVRTADRDAPPRALAQPGGDVPAGAALRHGMPESIPHSATCNPRSTLAPLGAMVAGLLLHMVGFAAQQARVSILALLLFTWGVIRLGGGPAWGRATVFPLGFLVFAIPVNALDTVGFWLRVWVIDVATPLAHAAGIDVIRNGTQLFSPDGRYTYDVAAACSGVRSLTAMAALSLLIGYLHFRSTWRRAVLLLLCFPLAYLGNLARITSIVFAAEAGGQEWGTRAHDWMGYGVFVIVFGGVLAAAAGLRRWAPESPGSGATTPAPPEAAEQPSGGAAVGRGGRRWAPVIAAVVVVLLASVEMTLLHRLSTLPPRGRAGVVLAADGVNPADLPTFIGGEWVGMPAQVTPLERQILPPDTGYARMNYVASRGRHQVFLSIVLSGRDRTSIHRPELCLVGQGWTIVGQRRHAFAYPGKDARFSATLLRVNRDVSAGASKTVVPQLVAYWFVSGDRVVPSYWSRMLHDAWNRVFRMRPDRWAYVLVQADATDGEEAALARMQAVLNGTLADFQRADVLKGVE